MRIQLCSNVSNDNKNQPPNPVSNDKKTNKTTPIPYFQLNALQNPLRASSPRHMNHQETMQQDKDIYPAPTLTPTVLIDPESVPPDPAAAQQVRVSSSWLGLLLVEEFGFDSSFSKRILQE